MDLKKKYETIYGSEINLYLGTINDFESKKNMQIQNLKKSIVSYLQNSSIPIFEERMFVFANKNGDMLFSAYIYTEDGDSEYYVDLDFPDSMSISSDAKVIVV